MIATITLNPSIDRNVRVRHLVKDDVNRAESVVSTPGGKGMNVSKVVRELGGSTRAYALLGGLTGRLWKELVAGLDVPFSAVWVKGLTRVNTVITDARDGTQTRISDLGPPVRAAEMAAFRKMLLAARPKPFLWALGGSLSRGMRPSTCRDLIRLLQKNGAPCILDTDGEALRLGIEARPFMIKPNEYEMTRLVGRSLEGIGRMLEAAQSVIRRGVGIVVLSLGPRGALFVTQKEAFQVLTPRVAVKSKVGAGDSLIGGFAMGLYRGMSLREAARLGVAASTSAVMREAPRLCRRPDIRSLLRRVRIKELFR